MLKKRLLHINKSNKKGFTLIELSIATAIFIILSIAVVAGLIFVNKIATYYMRSAQVTNEGNRVVRMMGDSVRQVVTNSSEYDYTGIIEPEYDQWHSNKSHVLSFYMVDNLHPNVEHRITYAFENNDIYYENDYWNGSEWIKMSPSMPFPITKGDVVNFYAIRPTNTKQAVQIVLWLKTYNLNNKPETLIFIQQIEIRQ